MGCALQRYHASGSPLRRETWWNRRIVFERGRRHLVAGIVALLLAPVTSHGAEYTLAVIPQFDQRTLFEAWRPIADEVGRRTGHRITLVTTLGVREFETEFLKGSFDLVYMNPYFLGKTLGTLGYEPLVRDSAAVSGILVVKRGGAIRSPKELQGKPVAFPTPNAVGACMLMRAELKQQFGVVVSPVFVRSVSNVALHVAKGLAAAGGLPEKGYSLLAPELREHLTIIHRTQPLAPHAIAAHPRVPAAEREAVRKALLDLAATDEGRALLAKVPMKSPVAATVEEYAAVAKMGLDAWYVPGAEEQGGR